MEKNKSTMILPVALLFNNIGLFILEMIGYHLCHSVVMQLDGYYHLCQAILCTVRILSQKIQFTYTSRQTYGLARVGVVGELVAFISFLSLSVFVFFESLKHIFDVAFVIPQRESSSNVSLKAHGHEHIHSLIDRPFFILGVGIYATISNVVLGSAILILVTRRIRKHQRELKQRRPSLSQPLPKQILTKSLLITDTLPIQHSFFQVFNMLIGPFALLTCGILLVMLEDRRDILIIYSRLVDPIIGCLLFVSCLIMISVPMREVVRLLLQANPCNLGSDQIEKMLRESVPGVSAIHQLHIWRLTPQKTLATVHVVFNSTENILEKYESINFIFQRLYIDHVTIQPEFALTNDENLSESQCQSPLNAKIFSTMQCCEEPLSKS